MTKKSALGGVTGHQRRKSAVRTEIDKSARVLEAAAQQLSHINHHKRRQAVEQVEDVIIGVVTSLGHLLKECREMENKRRKSVLDADWGSTSEAEFDDALGQEEAIANLNTVDLDQDAFTQDALEEDALEREARAGKQNPDEL